jgi:hypothetical protein
MSERRSQAGHPPEEEGVVEPVLRIRFKTSPNQKTGIEIPISARIINNGSLKLP